MSGLERSTQADGSVAPQRHIFSSQEAIPLQAGKAILKQTSSHYVMHLLLQAGQEALRCSSGDWDPLHDVSVEPCRRAGLHIEPSAYKHVKLCTESTHTAMRAVHAHEGGYAPNPFVAIENAAGTMVRLYAGFFDILPLDAWRHDDFVRAAGIGAFGKTTLDKCERWIAESVTVLYEKSIVAHAITEFEGALFAEGLALESMLTNRTSGLLDALFIKSQLLVHSESWQGIPRIQWLESIPLLETLVRDVIYVIFGVKLGQRANHAPARSVPTRVHTSEARTQVEELGRLLGPYLSPPENSNAPSPLGSGNLNSQNPIQNALGASPFQRRNSARHTQPTPSLQQGSALPSSASSATPQVRHNFEEIDRYYSDRATSLVVRDSVPNARARSSKRLIVGYQDCERGSVLDALDGHIVWSQTRPASSGRSFLGVDFYRSSAPLVIDCAGDASAWKGLPHLMLVVDSSGSMGFNMAGQGQARGKYDVVLSAAWGILRYIEEKGEAAKVEVNAINFSNTTETSGWQHGSSFRRVKETLARYQGGNTRLDTMVYQKAHQDCPGGYVTIMITDGLIAKSEETLEALRETARNGNSIVLLHMGDMNPFAEGIRNMGFPVHLIARPEDLIGLCLDVARANYGH